MGRVLPSRCLQTQRIWASLVYAVVTLTIGTAAGFLLTVPEIRSAEAGENDPAEERGSDAAQAVRHVCERKLNLADRRNHLDSAFQVVPPTERALAPILFAPLGHRFANGLLAPLTC